MAVARAARRRFRLDQIYFVPCGRPPHKHRPALSPYLHRFTLVALACAGEPAFIPSLLEAGPGLSGRQRFYSVDTVSRLRRRLGSRAHLYFLIGADSFLYLPTWKDFRRLLQLCDFIVAARPGFDLRRAARALPADLKARITGGARPQIRLAKSIIHFLPDVRMDISATEVRQAARRGQRLSPYLPPLVAGYCEKMKLYRRGR